MSFTIGESRHVRAGTASCKSCSLSAWPARHHQQMPVSTAGPVSKHVPMQTGQAPRGTTTPWGVQDMLQRTHTASWAGGAPGTSMTRISRLPRRQLSPSARATSIAGMRARSAAGPTTLAPYRRFRSSLPPTWSLPLLSAFQPSGRSAVLHCMSDALQHDERRNNPRRSARMRGRLLHTGAYAPRQACCCRQGSLRSGAGQARQ